MATSLVNFGPDLEPLAEEARRGAHPAGSRRDAVVVSGSCHVIVAALRDAQSASGGWCELEEVLPDDQRRTVFVNAAAVRFVAPDDRGER